MKKKLLEYVSIYTKDLSFEDAIKWLKENLGERNEGNLWDIFMYDLTYVIYFKKDEDMNLFKLSFGKIYD